MQSQIRIENFRSFRDDARSQGLKNDARWAGASWSAGRFCLMFNNIAIS